ncbi:lactonase 6-phosphogluconolactonase [Fadolivirus algeromassiliense]|jgi:hypothetical protein|uniref:Lactonase 6-phosphogluconolactonase n=1 Tax=Fadolivirus FV1/VV64 TaxID=3070911 RepID=A0A7D3UTZ6_9VIRU|nr:lactonase 6-phosphogluconolactonase [Fadolivirus algeromassiliense]QKF94730.1 lactonase 6-phosphogluconolactonase [Fadolivirus FV1/VV64]
MLTIKLLNLNRSQYGPLYINNVKRLAQATSVKFIDNNHLCATHLVGMYMQLYFIDYDNKNYKLLDQINTTYNNKICITDLIDHKEGLLVTSNFDKGTQTLYELKNNKFVWYKDIPDQNNGKQYCHGVKFYPYKENVICATYNRIPMVQFIDYIKNEVIYQIQYIVNHRPKDIAFIDKCNMLVYYTTSDVSGKQGNVKYKSQILYLKIDIDTKTHSIIDQYDIDDSHGDCIVFNNNVIFTNNQIGDSIMTFHIKDNKICFIESIDVFDKPHGIDVNYNNKLIAVTNYGDNTIKIICIPEKTMMFMGA